MVQGVGRNGELFTRLCDPEILIRCAKRAARGKRKVPEVADFLLHLEERCLELGDALGRGRWQPGPYHSFWIRDPKRRLISAAPFADRVVHHALVGQMEPFFEQRFVPTSFACRKGKGTHRALRLAFQWAQRHRYVLKADVQKFFPSLDHEVVKESVRRVIADQAFLDVLDRVIDGSNEQEPTSGYFPGDDLFTALERRRGLPIGNLTSQFLANVVLDRIDHRVSDEWGFGHSLRYCDDLLVFGDDKDVLHELRERLREALAGIRLHLHERKGGVHATRSAVPFLGFVLRGDRLRLQGQAVRRATRRLILRHLALRRGEVTTAEVTASVRSWLAHAAHGHTAAVVKAVLRRAFPGAGVLR